MKKYVLILLLLVSCQTPNYNFRAMVGEYILIESNDIYPLNGFGNFWSEEIDSYLMGDSINTRFSYYIYKELPRIGILSLKEDSTFNIFGESNWSGHGKWRIMGEKNDSIILSFNTYGKQKIDNTSILISRGGAFEGIRLIRIMNKKKLLYSCPYFNNETKFNQRYFIRK